MPQKFSVHELKIGDKFGYLEVVSEHWIEPNRGHRRVVKCKCICGKEKIILTSNLLRNTRSCGCKTAYFIHGKDPIGTLAKDGRKTCCKCGQNKELKHYHKCCTSKDGYDGRCNDCFRVYKKKTLLKKIGHTYSEYEALIKKQKNRCGCCGNKPSGRNVSLCIDHDHKTNQIRGLLCSRCNVGIGKLGDTLEAIQNALNYLKRAYGVKDDNLP